MANWSEQNVKIKYTVRIQLNEASRATVPSNTIQIYLRNLIQLKTFSISIKIELFTI